MISSVGSTCFGFGLPLDLSLDFAIFRLSTVEKAFHSDVFLGHTLHSDWIITLLSRLRRPAFLPHLKPSRSVKQHCSRK